MGIACSCVSAKAPVSAAKVIALHGSVQEFDRPMKVAQVMIDNPRHFVCDSNVLQAGRRISALTADEELELGHLYFLLPMRKLNHSLSPSETNSLAFRANAVFRRSTSKSKSIAKILPVLGDLCHSPADRKGARIQPNEEMNAEEKTAEPNDSDVSKLAVNNTEDLGELGGFKLKGIKYWKPALETITESPRILTTRINSVEFSSN